MSAFIGRPGTISRPTHQEPELTSLRDALWEAINGIEAKVADGAIADELEILDRVAETLGGLSHTIEASRDKA